MEYNKLIPELSVSNIQKSLQFYTKILGFKIEYKRPKNKFAFLSFQGSQIMIEEINDKWKTGKLEYPFGRGINFQIETRDVSKIFRSLKKYKYLIKKEPHKNQYKVKNKTYECIELLVQDPDGYLLRFSQIL